MDYLDFELQVDLDVVEEDVTVSFDSPKDAVRFEEWWDNEGEEFFFRWYYENTRDIED